MYKSPFGWLCVGDSLAFMGDIFRVHSQPTNSLTQRVAHKETMTTNRHLPTKLRGPKQTSKQTSNSQGTSPRAPRKKTNSAPTTAPKKKVAPLKALPQTQVPSQTPTATHVSISGTAAPSSILTTPPSGNIPAQQFKLPPSRVVTYNQIDTGVSNTAGTNLSVSKPPEVPDFVLEKNRIYVRRYDYSRSLLSFSFGMISPPPGLSKEPQELIMESLEASPKFLVLDDPQPPVELALWYEQERLRIEAEEKLKAACPPEFSQVLLDNYLNYDVDTTTGITSISMPSGPMPSTSGKLIIGKNTSMVAPTTGGITTTWIKPSQIGSSVSRLIAETPGRRCWTQQVYNLKTRCTETVILNDSYWFNFTGGTEVWHSVREDSTFDLDSSMTVTKAPKDHNEEYLRSYASPLSGGGLAPTYPATLTFTIGKTTSTTAGVGNSTSGKKPKSSRKLGSIARGKKSAK